MYTDILASAVTTSTGVLKDQANNNVGRARIKGVYIVPDTNAGSVVFRNGTGSGGVRLTVNTMDGQTNPSYVLMPGQGIVAQDGIHVTMTSVVSLVVFYA